MVQVDLEVAVNKIMKTQKTGSFKNNNNQIPINIIIHNPNSKENFDSYYINIVIETIKKIT